METSICTCRHNEPWGEPCQLGLTWKQIYSDSHCLPLTFTSWICWDKAVSLDREKKTCTGKYFHLISLSLPFMHVSFLSMTKELFLSPNTQVNALQTISKFKIPSITSKPHISTSFFSASSHTVNFYYHIPKGWS